MLANTARSTRDPHHFTTKFFRWFGTEPLFELENNIAVEDKVNDQNYDDDNNEKKHDCVVGRG